MIRKLFTVNLYVRIRHNRFDIRNLDSGHDFPTVYADTPFSSERLLVGQFSAAEPLLKTALKAALTGGFLARSPRLVIHPMEKVEGGLAQVEERIFTELGYGAGAIQVVLYTGAPLSDQAALALLQ